MIIDAGIRHFIYFLIMRYMLPSKRKNAQVSPIEPAIVPKKSAGMGVDTASNFMLARGAAHDMALTVVILIHEALESASIPKRG